MSDEITVDYWQTAYALGRAVEWIRSQDGDFAADMMFSAIVIELEKACPGVDWANAMTDSPAYHPFESDSEVNHDGTSS